MAKDLPNEVRSFLDYSKNSIDDYLASSVKIESTASLNNLREIIADIFRNKVKPYYSQKGIIINNGIFNFLLEPLKNAHFHGGTRKNHATLFELFLSPSVLVSSYADGGPYFTREDVKQFWENKRLFSEKHRVSNKEIGYEVGTPLIYGMADLIHVNTASGRLYLGLSVLGHYFTL